MAPMDDKQGKVQDQQAQDLGARRYADYIRFKHYTAMTFLFASPVLIALPPRRLNNMTALLVGAWVASGNHVLQEKTGRGIVDRISDAIGTSESGSMPTKRAREVQAQLRQARDEQIRRYEEEQRAGDPSVSAELEKLRARQGKDRGMIESLWLAGEKADWQKRRIEEEQEVFKEGKGYGELIKRYFRSAWPWGKTDNKQNDGNGQGDN